MPEVEPLVRRLYAAFLARDRELMDALLADDFDFTSPHDNHISKAAYFRRCWPPGDRFRELAVEKIVVSGAEAFVRYRARVEDGRPFRNTEYVRIESGRVKSVEVYFGREGE